MTCSDNITLLIDGDCIVYRAAFIAEESYYFGFSEGEPHVKAKHLADLAEGTLPCKVQEASMSVSDAFKMVDIMFNNLKTKLKASNIRVFLTDPDIRNNNRYLLDSTYKQQRGSSTRPLYYHNIRNYLIAKYKAEVVSGIEADDILGLNQTDDTIIVSHDKDLWMVPGRHYSFTLDREFTVTDPGKLLLRKDNKLFGFGFKWFCAQLLLGDQSDNIQGIRGIGPVKAFKLLDDKSTYKDMWDVILKAYEKEDSAALDINIQLLWMQRNEVHGDCALKWLRNQGLKL